MSHGSGLGSLFLKYEFTGSSVHVWGGSLEGRLEFTKKTEPRTLDELKSVILNGHRANTPPMGHEVHSRKLAGYGIWSDTPHGFLKWELVDSAGDVGPPRKRKIR